MKLQVEWMEEGAAGAVHWNGVEYKLLELHTHSPSEHKVKNQRYPIINPKSNPDFGSIATH
jgi:carbonic anhydrase